MNKKVASMADFTCNGTMQSPEQALQSALEDIGKEGALENGKKVLILALDDDGCYNTSFYQAGMKMSQCLALCEVMKVRFLQEMEYIPE